MCQYRTLGCCITTQYRTHAYITQLIVVNAYTSEVINLVKPYHFGPFLLLSKIYELKFPFSATKDKSFE